MGPGRGRKEGGKQLLFKARKEKEENLRSKSQGISCTLWSKIWPKNWEWFVEESEIGTPNSSVELLVLTGLS